MYNQKKNARTDLLVEMKMFKLQGPADCSDLKWSSRKAIRVLNKLTTARLEEVQHKTRRYKKNMINKVTVQMNQTFPGSQYDDRKSKLKNLHQLKLENNDTLGAQRR